MIANALYARSKPLRMATGADYEDRWNSLPAGARESVLRAIRGDEGASDAASIATAAENASLAAATGATWTVEIKKQDGHNHTATAADSEASSDDLPPVAASGAGWVTGGGSVAAVQSTDTASDGNHPQDTAEAQIMAAGALPRPWTLCAMGKDSSQVDPPL